MKKISGGCRRAIAYMTRNIFHFKTKVTFSKKYYQLFEFVFRALGDKEVATSWSNIVTKNLVPKGVKLINTKIISDKVDLKNKKLQKAKPKKTRQEIAAKKAPLLKRYKNRISVDPKRHWEMIDSRIPFRKIIATKLYKQSGLFNTKDMNQQTHIDDKLTDM